MASSRRSFVTSTVFALLFIGLVGCPMLLADTPAAEPSRDEPLVSNSFFNTDVRQALADVALDAGVTILQDESVTGFVTLELEDVPLSRALKLLLLPLGMVQAEIEPGVYLVTAADPMAPSFRLIATSKVLPISHIEAQNLVKLLPERFAKFVTVDPTASRCLIYAPEELMDAIMDMIRSLDAAPPQVMIEALVLEANAGDVKSLGLAAATTHIAGSVSGGIINYQSREVGGSDSRPGTGGPYPVVDNILVGLSALMRTNKAVLRANPRIVASDGQEAEIEVGTEQYFSLLTGSAAYAYTRLEKVDATIRLAIMPRVIPETGEIMCRIEPSVADVAGEGAEGLPVITVRRAKSNVRIKSGQAIVIGGLLQETETRSESRVPVLGDLPVIGALFRSTRRDAGQRDIIFVISPHLLDADGRCEGPLLSEVLMSATAVTHTEQLQAPAEAKAANAVSPIAEETARTRKDPQWPTPIGRSFHLPN